MCYNKIGLLCFLGFFLGLLNILLLIFLPFAVAAQYFLILCCHPYLWWRWIDFAPAVFQARFSVPLQELSQSRRVVVSHNVDKTLKEGNKFTFFVLCLSHVHIHVNKYGGTSFFPSCEQKTSVFVKTADWSVTMNCVPHPFPTHSGLQQSNSINA